MKNEMFIHHESPDKDYSLWLNSGHIEHEGEIHKKNIFYRLKDEIIEIDFYLLYEVHFTLSFRWIWQTLFIPVISGGFSTLPKLQSKASHNTFCKTFVEMSL